MMPWNSSLQWAVIVVSVVYLCEKIFVNGEIGCRDNAGNPVDWFIVVKLPQLESSSYNTVKNGVGQIYMDANSQQWTFVKEGIDETSSHAVYNTLQQIYSKGGSEDVAYVMYNDESPDGKTSYSYGHTKGDLCFDRSSGFWLVHSVPKFPPSIKDGYRYPVTGHKFGQSLLCVTYGYKFLNLIGEQLLYNYPQIYDYILPQGFLHDNANLSQAVQKKHVVRSPWYHSAVLTSEAGQQFTSLAKFTNYNQDLYDAWLVQFVKSDILVETWLNGRGRLPSNCSGSFKVLNVQSLTFMNFEFDNSHDHSKWAVSSSNEWICVGDINRESSQKHRAGGTVCSRLPSAAKMFRVAVNSTQHCTSEARNLPDQSTYINS